MEYSIKFHTEMDPILLFNSGREFFLMLLRNVVTYSFERKWFQVKEIHVFKFCYKTKILLLMFIALFK